MEGIVPENDGTMVVVGDRECEGDDGRTASVAIAARYWMTFLVLSVFPAPDSPLKGHVRLYTQRHVSAYVMRML